MKKRKAFSDGYLMGLWRKAVLEFWGHRCGFCGAYGDEGLECHHIVRRKNKLLRWNWRNGIPLCKWPISENKPTCHQEGHSKLGERRISLLTPFYEMLVFWERKVSKGVLQDENKTDNEFRKDLYDDLKECIGGY